jgi:hypothetical protein
MRAKFLETNETTTVANRSCAAHDCGLFGTMSHSAGDNSTYYCRFHYGKSAKESGEITRRIRAKREIWEAAETIRAGAGTFDAIARRNGRQDLCAGFVENRAGREVDERLFPALHYQRVMGTLMKEIKGGLSGMQSEERRVSGDVQHNVPAVQDFAGLVGGLQAAAKARDREDDFDLGTY